MKYRHGAECTVELLDGAVYKVNIKVSQVCHTLHLAVLYAAYSFVCKERLHLI